MLVAPRAGLGKRHGVEAVSAEIVALAGAVDDADAARCAALAGVERRVEHESAFAGRFGDTADLAGQAGDLAPYSSNSAEIAASINRRAPLRRRSVKGSDIPAGAASETRLSLLTCGVLLLLKPCLFQLDFSKDTPHVSTHPYTTFDHSSYKKGG